jgi:hemin uptake protein HemP
MNSVKGLANKDAAFERGSNRESGSPIVINVMDLFQGRNEIALRLGEAVYQLKITRFGKLILNK